MARGKPHKGASREVLGDPNRVIGRGRQNECDRVMVKDPPIDLEEVVVGIRSLGSKDPLGALETVLPDGELNH